MEIYGRKLSKLEAIKLDQGRLPAIPQRGKAHSSPKGKRGYDRRQGKKVTL